MVSCPAGGYAATRFNPKAVLLGGAIVWSTFTLLTPAMAGNVPALLATRAAMGFGEGVTFPAISNLFATCAPTCHACCFPFSTLTTHGPYAT